jgi:O-acetyl-ADP-ribose deacetylase (regulator of RNase III)
MKKRIELIQGDITSLKVDAIVNAANSGLKGGGGVDGAIHRAAGPQLLAETQTLGGCPTGQARLTKGYQLPALHVIHTVGPIWDGGDRHEKELLADCYLNSLQIATEKGFKTVAFPNISTGVYNFPKQEAAQIAFQTVSDYLRKNKHPEKVIFVAFDEENFELYRKLEEQEH